MASSSNRESATLSGSTPDRRPLFDIILPRLHKLDAKIVEGLLFCNNADLADGCEKVLYANLDVEVDVPGYISQEDEGQRDRGRRKVETVLKYPRLGQHVQKLTFRHPPPSTRQNEGVMDESTRETERIQAWSLAAQLLRICPKLQKLTWELCFGVNSEIWQNVSSLLTYLDIGYPPLDAFADMTAAVFPRISPELEYFGSGHRFSDAGSVLVGEGGWGLGPGWEYLKVLKVAGLSQNGAKTIATHLQMLCSRIIPTIISLDISTHFLDNTILSSISQYGQLGSLKHLTLATTGTRLTADGIQQALEECTALESFVLKDGEGRLDKHTWAQIEAWPPRLRTFEIEIDESANHHSWVLHHLASIHRLPFGQFEKFAVRRLVHLIARLPFPPVGVAVPTVQKGYELSAIPSNLLEAIVDGESEIKMGHLCLDWWEIGPNELDGLVKTCPALRVLQVAISFPIAKMVTMMQTTFAGSAELEEMVITSPPKYNLEFAPTKSKPDYLVPDMPPYLITKLQDPDPSIPETKDLRKFVRRMPKLKSLKWSGRGGKGEWTFAKKTTLVSVSFRHSAVESQRDWKICQLDPPRFKYEEPEATRPTLLQMPPPATVLSSPIVEFPSFSRSGHGSTFGTGVGTSGQRPSVSPSSPKHTKSASYKDSHGRDDDETPPGPVIQTPRRRGTMDGSTPSLSGGSASVSSSTSESFGRGRARQMSIDLSKSTKRLTIGHAVNSPTASTAITKKPQPSSSSYNASRLLKTTSAPARTATCSDEQPQGRQGRGSGNTGASSGRVKYSDKAMKERKIDGPRRSK